MLSDSLFGDPGAGDLYGNGGGFNGEESGAQPERPAAVRIPYRQNRCLLFNGARFHHTDPFSASLLRSARLACADTLS